MRKVLGVVLIAPLLMGLRCGTDSGSSRSSSGPGEPCDDLRKQDLAVCTFREQQQCAGDVTHTLDGYYKDKAWWRVEGCGQHLDCWYSNEDQTRMRCTWPHDLDDAKARLSVESGCPADELQATAQQRIYRCSQDVGPGCRWNDRVLVSVGWRLAGCGRTFSCSAAYESADEEEPIETSELKSVECKAALDQPAPAAPPVAAPASQPVACGPMSCAGCCNSELRCVPGTRDDECGTGGQRCVNCARDEGERKRCNERYACVQ